MADNPNAYKPPERRVRKDIPKAVKTPREKVTAVPLLRDDAAQAESAEMLEAAPEWSTENLPSEAATVSFMPAVSETRIIPTRKLPPPRAVDAAILSALVSLAKFAQRKPGTSLALAAAAGLAAGIGVRRISTSNNR